MAMVVGDVTIRQLRMRLGSCFQNYHQKYGEIFDCANDYRYDGLASDCFVCLPNKTKNEGNNCSSTSNDGLN